MIKKLIAITGQTGTGKTYLLKKYDYKNTIYLDDYVKNVLYREGNNVFKEVTSMYGRAIITKNKIDTKKLGKIVLNDLNQLETLTKIVNPQIRDYLKSLRNDIYIIEIATYIKYEHYFHDLFDEVILIISNHLQTNDKFNYLDKNVKTLVKKKIKYSYLVDRDKKNSKILFFKVLDKLLLFK